MNRYAVVLLAAAAVLAAPVRAQNPAAVAMAEQALVAANDRTPLTVGFASLVTAKASAYGAYTARASNHYGPGETVLFYVEPLGLKHKQAGALITCGLSMDLFVKRAGTIVFGKEDFINADFPSHHPLLEIMLNGDLTVNAPADAYEIELVLHDHGSSETARATLPFVIDAPTAK